MAKKVTDKDTKQTTKATSENIMNSDQMKEHLDNLVDMAKKNDRHRNRQLFCWKAGY